MSEPKRWSESGSEVDPVLRSVMRYSKEQGPSPEQVREMMRAARAAEPKPSVWRFSAKRVRPFLLAAAAVVAASASFAAYQVYTARAVAPPSREEPPFPLPKRDLALSPRPEPAASAETTVEPSLAPASSAALAPASSAALAPASSAALAPVPKKKAVPVSEEELALLEQARRSLQSDPAAALAFTQDHAARHPAGSFAEERDALTIEALRRLNRHEEAAMKLRSFEARYPRSPYRRRLGIGQ